nr:MAG TPA: hypothetical protein [Caudoviricetes sp.]
MHRLISVSSALIYIYIRVAAAFPVAYKTMAYPEGQIKSYGSCSRHIGTPFSRCRENDIYGQKKCLRPRSHRR